MRSLGAFWRARGRLPSAPATSLTGCEAQWALEHLAHCCDLVPFPVQPAHLWGSAGQPVGGVGLAAVSHDQYFDASRQRACRLPGGLREIAYQSPSLQTPILLELADKIPAI